MPRGSPGAMTSALLWPSNQMRKAERSALRKALLVDPMIICCQLRVDERANGIDLRLGLFIRQHLVHRPLALARRETDQQAKRLGAAERFTRRPLGKRGAEDLRPRAFGKQL